MEIKLETLPLFMLPIEAISRLYKRCYKLGQMSIVPIMLEKMPLFMLPI
jgi:hypothetical protein